MEMKELDPRQLTAADVEVGVLQVTDKAVKLRLWPKPERVRAIMDDLYQPDGWSLAFTTAGGKMCCALAASCVYEGGDVRAIARGAICPGEYRMISDLARNEMDGAFIMAAGFMGIGDAVLQLPSMVLRADQVQILPKESPDRKRISYYYLGDNLSPTNLVYDDAGNIVEVDFTRRDGGIVKWQKR